MGKSGGRKKKGNVNQVAADKSAATANGDVAMDYSIFLKRAHELKEEGNRRYQNKDFVGALEQYACLMQMKPTDYVTVIAECTMALQVQPRFVRALHHRARAYKAIGKYEMAMQDVEVLLAAEPNHGDALDIARKLRMAVGPRTESQVDLQSRPHLQPWVLLQFVVPQSLGWGLVCLLVLHRRRQTVLLVICLCFL